MKFKGKDASLRQHVQRLEAAREARIMNRIAADAARAAAPPVIRPSPPGCVPGQPGVVVRQGVPAGRCGSA